MPPRKLDTNGARREGKEALFWPIKKADGEPLTRVDVQYEFLTAIFSDRTYSFTAPVDSSIAPADEPIMLNFDQLYLESILSSMKITSSARARLIEHPDFAINFCKVCLLVNTGRINTTMAFYPTMKTALRTYHPIPCLQTDEVSRRDMQDAPRLKALLKGCLLDWEVNEQPSSIKDVAKKQSTLGKGMGPGTTIATLIFFIFNETMWISEKYFPTGFDVYDILFPSDIPSAQRAQAFLKLVHHVLESGELLDDFASPDKRALFSFTRDAEQSAKENVETKEDEAYAEEMRTLRNEMVKDDEVMQKREEIMAQKGVHVNTDALLAQSRSRQDGTEEPAAKKRKLAKKQGPTEMSYAKALRVTQPRPAGDLGELEPDWVNQDTSDQAIAARSTLPSVWRQVRRDLKDNRDPDYDSDDEDPWTYDLLARRKLLTFPTAAGGRERVAPSTMKEFPEWLRRRNLLPGEEDEEDFYPKLEMEQSQHQDDDDE